MTERKLRKVIRYIIKEERGKGTGREYSGGADICICPNCGNEIAHDGGEPCNQIECPECGTKMTGKGAPGEKK